MLRLVHLSDPHAGDVLTSQVRTLPPRSLRA